MRRACACFLLLSLSGLMVGCGGARAEEVATASTSSGGEADARERRIQDLESRLAETTSEVHSLRSELDEARARGESVRIGADSTPSARTEEAAPDFTILASDADDSASSGSRPVLRLYGAPEVAVLPGPPAPWIVPAPPVGEMGRLPVVLTPGTPDLVPAIPMSPLTVATAAVAPAPVDEAAAEEYRVALAHVSAREWDLALDSLARFVAQHPDHAYADNAMYWRGEVLYARRDYAAAIVELTSMIERFPSGNKVPDALLRIGFAYQRLGESERARDIFRRVREQYPGTVAARTASREDA